MKIILRIAEPMTLSFDVVGDYIFRSEWRTGVDMSSTDGHINGTYSKNSSGYFRSNSHRINGFLKSYSY